jgi:tetratricopeptide (TPR) repeat protein
MENKLKQERVLYHYNLGVAYSQAKFYDEAIDEYEKSLKFNANNFLPMNL